MSSISQVTLKNFSPKLKSLANELILTSVQLLRYEPPFPSNLGDIAAYVTVRDPSSGVYHDD